MGGEVWTTDTLPASSPPMPQGVLVVSRQPTHLPIDRLHLRNCSVTLFTQCTAQSYDSAQSDSQRRLHRALAGKS